MIKHKMIITSSAVKAMNALNGVFCIYKPAGVRIEKVRSTILNGLCNDLNSMNVRPNDKMVEIIGATNAPMEVKVTEDLSDDPMVVGPRYQIPDFKMSYATHLGKNTSGVLMVGINKGTFLTLKMNKAMLTRAYKIHGQLGLATDTYFVNGKIEEKATFKKVTREKIDNVVAHMQAAHQQKMYEISGLDMSTQAGYDLASRGLIRPVNNKIPVIYGMKCVHFNPPDFTIEIQSINEYEKYLHTLIHDIGIQVKSVAHCTGAQCIRHGKFTVDHALLSKHWQLQFILDSIKQCHQILSEDKRILRPNAELEL